jgi:hypothetical protein
MQCLAGPQCLPAPGSKTYRIIETIFDKEKPRNINLVTEIPAPRILSQTYANYVSSASKCFHGNTSNAENATLCLVKEGANGKTKETIECLEETKRQGHNTEGECLLMALPDAQGRQFASCLLNANKGAQAAIMSSGGSSLPENSRKVISCIFENRTIRDTASAVACIGGGSPDQQIVVRCLGEHRGDWASAALCTLQGKAVSPHR